MIFTNNFSFEKSSRTLDIDTAIDAFIKGRYNIDKILFYQVDIANTRKFYYESVLHHTPTNVPYRFINAYNEIIALFFPSFHTLIYFYEAIISHTWIMHDISYCLKDGIQYYFIIDWRSGND